MADVDIDVDIQTDDAINDIRRLNSAVDAFDNKVQTADKTTQRFERRIGGSFRQALQDVRVLLGAIGLGIFLRELVQVNTAFEQVRTTLVAASDNMNIVASDFAFIRAEAVRLGMPVKEVGGEFARLAAATRGTVLEGGPAREIYSALAESFVATGQSADEFRLAVLAVNQMVSKGRVQAEELRGQLGERLPGAYQAAARAMGKTTAELSKMLEMGQVTAEVLLPKLAIELRKTFGPAFAAAQNSPKFVMGQFQVAVESLLYTLSNGGFMVEFLGMLKDISNYLGSEEGARGAERLGSALGFLMSQVRALANVIVQNADTIVALTAGFGTAGAILGIKALAGWIANLIGLSGGLGAILLNPWVLLAFAVGAAVFALAKYGDELITVGNSTARVGDWFRAAWEVPSQKIRDIVPHLRDMVAQIPGIGTAFIAAETGLSVFNDTFAGSRNISESFASAIDAMKASLSSSLGPEVWGRIEGIFSSIKAGADALKTGLTSVFDQFIVGAQIAWIYAQEFGRVVWAVIVDVVDSVKNVAIDIYSVFNDAFTLISQLFGGLNGQDLFGMVATGAIFVADLVIGAFLSIIDIVEWAVDFIAILVDALMPVLAPIAEAIGSVFGKIADYLKDIFNMNPDLSAFQVILNVLGEIATVVAGVVSVVVGIISGVSQVVGQILDTIFDVIGGVWEAFEDVIVAVVDLFGWFTQSSMQSATDSAAAQEEGAFSSAKGWITFGDIAIGVFLSVIDIIGGVIKQITNLVQAIIEAGRRFGSFLDATATGMAGLATGNVEQLTSAGLQMREVFTTPIEVGFVEDGRNLLSSLRDNFSVVSGAVDIGRRTADGFGGLGEMDNNFGQLSSAARTANSRAFGPNSEINAEAGANGRALAAAYFSGMGNEIANRASTLTDAATQQQRDLERAQNQAAADAARAYADREAGINREDGTETPKAGGRGGRGNRQSPTDRANDRIAELAVEIAMNRQLTSALADQSVTREQMEATIKATEALRRAGFDMSYQEAIAAGGVARQLAAMAYEAETTENKLNDVKKAVNALGEINTENSQLETQLRAAQNLAVNREEYGFQLEAMKELQQANINLTYEEALASDALTASLARAAYQRAVNKDMIQDSEAVARGIESYREQTRVLGGYIGAVQAGGAATARYQAEVAAQQEVMSLTGRTVWEGVGALNANELALYRNALAFNTMTAAGGSFAEISGNIETAFNDMFNPLENGRQQIRDLHDVTALSLQAMYDAIIVKTPEIEYAFKELFRKMNLVASVDMMRLSDNLGDRFTAWMVDTQAQVQDWAGNISSIWGNAFDGMVDVLTNFVMTGKFEWRDFALSVIQEITKMMIKWLAFMAIKAAASAFGIVLPFADGGIMSSGGSVPLRPYARGGIANSPQMALFGEGSLPEAYVPLPDGRTIPVTLAGLEGLQGGNVYNTTVMFDASALLSQMTPTAGMFEPRVKSFSEADTRRSDQVYAETTKNSSDIVIHTEVNYSGAANSGGQQGDNSESQRKFMQSMAKEISQMVRVQVIEVVRDESRPGGQFNRTGRRDGF